MALKHWSTSRPSLSICCCPISRMPVMDGIALATATADLTPAMPILLMTGYAEQRERAEPLMRIVVDVVEKPFTPAADPAGRGGRADGEGCLRFLIDGNVY